MLALAGYSFAAEDSPLLVQSPTLSKTEIVFAYGGYLWSVPRDGGNARQLTTGGHESGPQFSPDGKFIAFTGEYDGNMDVFVMPAEGGEPRRLTWHPGADVVVGWTPDSKRILFRSARVAYADFDRLYTVRCRRRGSGSVAHVARRSRLVFAGCIAACLCSKFEMARIVEEISRWTDHPCIHRQIKRPVAGKIAAREFQ